MRTLNRYVITISSILSAFFIITLCYFIYSEYIYNENSLHNIFLAQLIMFTLASCSTLVFSIIPLFRDTRGSTIDISKIVLLSDTNTPTDEFLLINRTSAMIVKGDFVYISLEKDILADEYAVLNRVDNLWYIERVSDIRSVGLKRAGEQYVYKLKPDILYKLNINDTVYIENERLLLV